MGILTEEELGKIKAFVLSQLREDQKLVWEPNLHFSVANDELVIYVQNEFYKMRADALFGSLFRKALDEKGMPDVKIRYRIDPDLEMIEVEIPESPLKTQQQDVKPVPQKARFDLLSDGEVQALESIVKKYALSELQEPKTFYPFLKQAIEKCKQKKVKYSNFYGFIASALKNNEWRALCNDLSFLELSKRNSLSTSSAGGSGATSDRESGGQVTHTEDVALARQDEQERALATISGGIQLELFKLPAEIVFDAAFLAKLSWFTIEGDGRPFAKVHFQHENWNGIIYRGKAFPTVRDNGCRQVKASAASLFYIIIKLWEEAGYPADSDNPFKEFVGNAGAVFATRYELSMRRYGMAGTEQYRSIETDLQVLGTSPLCIELVHGKTGERATLSISSLITFTFSNRKKSGREKEGIQISIHPVIARQVKEGRARPFRYSELPAIRNDLGQVLYRYLDSILSRIDPESLRKKENIFRKAVKGERGLLECLGLPIDERPFKYDSELYGALDTAVNLINGRRLSRKGRFLEAWLTPEEYFKNGKRLILYAKSVASRPELMVSTLDPTLTPSDSQVSKELMFKLTTTKGDTFVGFREVEEAIVRHLRNLGIGRRLTLRDLKRNITPMWIRRIRNEPFQGLVTKMASERKLKLEITPVAGPGGETWTIWIDE